MLRRKMSRSVRNKLDFLLASQYWSEGEIREYQENKLRSLVKHCANRVPYYRKMFARNGIDVTSFSIEDLSRIDVLTKDCIVNSFENLIEDGVDRGRLIMNSTGGSTGRPLNFYQDMNYRDWKRAATIRAWKHFVGFGESELEALIWGAEKDIGKGLGIKKTLYHIVREGLLPLNTFDIDEKLIRRFAFYYNLLRPRILRGYASSLYFVARFISEKGIVMQPPSAIISSAEMMWPAMREVVESVFKAKVFDSYGCREVSQIGTECASHNGLHVVCENQFVELVDGQIIVTNLNNYCMPLLRYKIGDVAERIESGVCPCGRKSPRIIGLKGRESEMIALPNGKVVHGEYFTHLFYGRFGTRAFSAEYNRKEGSLTIRCDGIRDEDRAEIKGLIRRDLQLEDVRFEDGGTADKSPSGKYRFVSVVES